jgi:chromosome partitioning protein
MAMRVIAVINQKGGCGKTTTSINLSACLARLGQRTLLVDLDPQGHCAVGLAVPEEQIERSVFETLIEAGDGKTCRLQDIVWQIASDFDLAPSTIRLAAFEQLFAGRAGRDTRVGGALAQVSEKYRWCILDCPPSVGLITFNALKAADEIIVPVETGFFSLHGLTKMLQTLDAMKERAGKDVRVRILPTLYDTRTKLAREVLSELRAKFKGQLMESTVNFNTKLKEAASFGQPITEYDPGSRGYKDFLNLARELMGEQPLEVEQTPGEPMSRPMELVQRAKALANLTNVQFGRGTVPMPASPAPMLVPGPMEIGANAATGAFNTDTSAFSTDTGELNTETIAFNAAASTFNADRLALTDLKQESAAVAEQTTSMVTSAATAAMALYFEPLEGVAVIEAAVDRSGRPVRDSRAPRAALTTEEKLADFYGVRRVGGEVQFATRFTEAMNVQVAGDFNNWVPESTPMQADPEGRWVAQLSLRPGRYRYRLVVDGRWTTDPHNSYVESNQFGELNNVVEVD